MQWRIVMFRTVLLSAAFVAAIASAQATELTNSGTSSYLAQEIRVCNEQVDPTERANCKVAARNEERPYVRGDAALPLNWAQDHWR
jgi:hypothetical protein